MAKRYALVPETWLSSRNGVESTFQNNNFTSKPEVTIAEQPKENKTLVHLAEIMPKNLRSRARMILHYLENGNVTVNDMQRIVYDDDGNVGSHVLDLIRYAISPFVKTRPLDWPQFYALVQKLGVPSSALASRNVNNNKGNSVLDKWKPY